MKGMDRAEERGVRGGQKPGAHSHKGPINNN